MTPVLARTKSFGCCLDPPQLLEQLTRGSKRLRGRKLVHSVGEAPAVAISTASAHLLGASLAPRRTRGHRAALLVHAPTSVDQRPEKSLQMKRALALVSSGMNRGMPSKSRRFACSDRVLCKQEVTGSNPVGSTREVPANRHFSSTLAKVRTQLVGSYGSVMEASAPNELP